MPMKIPEDVEQRKIIDKLANFVARNGPKFEELTKSKQKDSPKFSFLFGGDDHEYYKWKVGLERAKVEAQKAAGGGDPQQQQQPPQQLQQQQQSSTSAEIKPITDTQQLDLTSFRELVQKLILACTKDNIQNGKNWIVSNAKTEEDRRIVAQYLFRRLLEEVLPFQQKLHIVYLINDVLHHSRKKDLPQLQEALQEYILPIIGIVVNGEAAENKQKISKVLKIWENQSFFSEDVRGKLKDPSPLYDQFLNFIDAEKADMKADEEKARSSVAPPTQDYNYQQPPPNFPPPAAVPGQAPPPAAGQPYQQQPYQQWNPQGPPPPVSAGQQDFFYSQPPPGYQGPPPSQDAPPSHFPPPSSHFPPPQHNFPPPREDGGVYDHPPPPPHGPPNTWNQPPPYDRPPPHSYQSGLPPPQGVQTFDYSHQSAGNYIFYIPCRT